MDLDLVCPVYGPPTAALKVCLQNVMMSGHYILYRDEILRAIEMGCVSMVVVAAQAQEPYKSQIVLATLCQPTIVKIYNGTAWDLGRACFLEHVNAIAILNPYYIVAINSL